MKTRKIKFGFDERSYEPIEKMAQQGRFGDAKEYEEIIVTNQETGQQRILIIPKEVSDGSSDS